MGDSKEPPSEKTRARKVKEGVKGVFYGMAAHGHVTAALRTRMYLEHLFMFITLGDIEAMVPEKIIRRTSMGRSLTLVGEGDHLAVWNRDDWENRAQWHLDNWNEGSEKQI